MRIIRVNIWYSGRIIGFYENIPCGFPARFTHKHFLRLDTAEFFEILEPINQTVPIPVAAQSTA
jgi:hypothetical protein